MRSTGSIRSLALVLLFYITTSQGQRLRNCRPGTSCISIRSCPQMIKLIRSGDPSSVRQVRNSICGFSQRNSLVCCPSTGAETTPAPVTPPQLGNSENPLPEFCGRPSTEDKIIGGTEAKIGAYPWIVALGYSQPGVDNLQFVCSGSIISSRYVLTAAHCVVPSELGGKRLAAIHLGDFDLSTPRDCQRTVIGPKCQAPHIVAGPEQVIVHPQFDKRGKASDDIALIRLNLTLDFEGEANIEPVCLPSPSLNVRSFVDGREPIAAGWGFTENGSHSSVLLRVKVPLVDDQGCKDLYKDDFVGNQLCVGGVGGRDTCNGDSGGPLILPESNGPPFTQIGVVSFGVFPCGLQSFPGVYSSVADYRDWIIQNLRP